MPKNCLKLGEFTFIFVFCGSYLINVIIYCLQFNIKLIVENQHLSYNFRDVLGCLTGDNQPLFVLVTVAMN